MAPPPPARTSLYDRHVALGARTGDFAGWEMPLLYASAKEEHLAVRRRCGLFDVSHMGQLEVTGPGARAYLQRALTNDVTAIGPGQGQYTLILQDDGGAIDDLIVYALPDRYLLVVNASNVAACAARLEERLPGDVSLADRTREVAMLALQGPRWAEVVEPLAASPAPLSLDYFEIAEDAIAGVPALVARTGYTGEAGIEILCPWDRGPELWDALLARPEPPAPAGLVARDTLRLEMGYALYGQELTRERTPIEAGLRWACDLAHGGFAGAETLIRQAEEGTAERLTAFELTEPGIPRPGQSVLHDGQVVGRVTSGTLSPILGVGIGMAYVRSDLARPDNEIVIDVRGKPKSARTARRPLVGASPRQS
jgi:aminomethyltransferase